MYDKPLPARRRNLMKDRSVYGYGQMKGGTTTHSSLTDVSFCVHFIVQQGGSYTCAKANYY
ncbi:hypothetical protein MKY75_11195 [Paenibacillus sp. FSL L8-0663]|uniref:hypothetical protein n=1 Tax=Paenibacillus sp. FSL L8-0663 TaxID=2921606 RepID=UPI0030FAA737